MDNLTHSFVGLAASKAGLEKLSPYTTLLSILAASSPDADIVVLLFGDRWSFLQHHRGITHSIVGAIGLALILPTVFYLVDHIVARIRSRRPTVRLRGLIVASLVVTATHPFMDWTNNYGIRPWLPWSGQWFYGDFVFIIDPFLWLAFGGACFLLTSKSKPQIALWLLLGLVLTYLVMSVPPDRGLDHPWALRTLWIIALLVLLVSFKLGASRRWKHRIALTAFMVVALYWGGLASLHSLALAEARRAGAAIASQNGESITDVAAMPTLANPLHWLCVVETERAAYRFDLTLTGSHVASDVSVRHERADTSSSRAVGNALQDRRAQIFLGFARFPVTRVVGEDCMTQTLVQFADLRYTQPGSARGTFSLELPVDCPIPNPGNEEVDE